VQELGVPPGGGRRAKVEGVGHHSAEQEAGKRRGDPDVVLEELGGDHARTTAPRSNINEDGLGHRGGLLAQGVVVENAADLVALEQLGPLLEGVVVHEHEGLTGVRLSDMRGGRDAPALEHVARLGVQVARAERRPVPEMCSANSARDAVHVRDDVADEDHVAAKEWQRREEAWRQLTLALLLFTLVHFLLVLPLQRLLLALDL